MDEKTRRRTEKIEREYRDSGIEASHHHPMLHRELVEMRDGIRLDTYYWLPEREGSFPTILARSCYPRHEAIYCTHGRELARRGYAYVYQFCRGTGNSEGEWKPNGNEREDGLDTIDWLLGQPWSGDIGYTGSSYLALTGWAMADVLPKRVKSLYLTQYGTDRYTSAYKDRLFRQDVLTSWAMENAGFKIKADYIESCRFMPHNEVDEKLWGGRLDWYRDWVENVRREDDYWQQGFWKQLAEIPGKVTIPVYMGEGWYDHHLGSALLTYENLSDKAKEHSVLNIGCWNHSFDPCMEGRAAKNLQNSDTLTMLEWFETTLKRRELPRKRVRTYQINADRWREWDSWPLSSGEERVLYLSCNESGICGLAEKAEESGVDSVSYVYDPAHPVQSHGAESMLRSMDQVGSLLQPEPGYRPDVVSFVGVTLERDLEIVGKIRVELLVATEAEDTAFTAKLMEVFPGGRTYNIRGSIATIAAQHESYIPKEKVLLKIEMWDIDWLVSKGSKLRLDVSSSDFPQYAVHSNYKGVWSKQTATTKAEQSVFLMGGYSKVILPVQ